MPANPDDPAKAEKPEFPVAPQAASLLRRLAPPLPAPAQHAAEPSAEATQPEPEPPIEPQDTPPGLPRVAAPAAEAHPARPSALLRKSGTAGLLGLTILDNWSGDVLQVMGQFDVPRYALAPPIVETQRPLEDTTTRKPPTAHRLGDGRWVGVVYGVFTISVTLFSAEPSTVQLVQHAKLHRDFEQQNRPALEVGEMAAPHLTFPQEALF